MNNQQHSPTLWEQEPYTRKVEVPNVDFSHPVDKTPETYFPAVKVFNGHCRSIYDMMMSRSTVTAKGIYEALGTLKATSRLSDLRKKGVLFNHSECRTEEGVLFYSYSMTPEQIEQNKIRFTSK